MVVINGCAGAASPRVGRRPPTRPDWNGTSEVDPSLAKARPGVDFEICAASSALMTSVDSAESVTRRAMRRFVLARMAGEMTPLGRCVAKSR